ncbi:MAG: hypothetical protein ACI9WU_004612, partial [Myxococcota bacterium]
MLEPEPRLVSPMPQDPDVAFWHSGSGWRYRQRGQAAATLLVGDTWSMGEHTFEAVAVDMSSTGDSVTVVDGGLEQPLRIVARYDTVHLHHGNSEPAALSGVGARLISELAVMGCPVEWRVLAREVWGN